ncbi:MAG: group II intron reverse transcriptase/maturase [Nanoarchaeota archaeon]|nr:group II intron reverse transcriptase/maturase [Nanoarchaeota archaeon]
METTKQEMEATQSRSREDRWKWVERTIWTERMLMALDNGVIGYKWFSMIDKVYKSETLIKAWENTASNKGAAGIDKVTIEKFAKNAHKYLKELIEELSHGTYQPSKIRRTYIPKSDGKMRPLGIPTIKDRIVQGSIKMVIEPIWEKEFLPMSYGFRPGRGAHEAINEVAQYIKEGYVYVVDADIRGYFDNIPHERLMQLLNTKIADGHILHLINEFLTVGIIEEMKEWVPTRGTPQGGVLSPLLANVYLHPLDVLMIGKGYKMIRYADDFVILCRNELEAKEAKEIIEQWMKENSLELHPEKTRICNCMQEGQGFEFLGYYFERGYKFVRKKSYEKLREKIRKETKHTVGKNIKSVVDSLNKILVGWFNYFKLAQGKVYQTTDCLVRRRLRAILRKQEKKPGMGKTFDDHKKWPNEYFAKLELFSLEVARAKWRVANQSR